MLVLIFVPIVVGLLTFLLITSGPWMPLYLWAFFFTLSLFALTIFPTLIQPLFNKFEALPEVCVCVVCGGGGGRLVYCSLVLWAFETQARLRSRSRSYLEYDYSLFFAS